MADASLTHGYPYERYNPPPAVHSPLICATCNITVRSCEKVAQNPAVLNS